MGFPHGEKVQIPTAMCTPTLGGEHYAKGKRFVRILHHAA
jgi:hypothetical protein